MSAGGASVASFPADEVLVEQLSEADDGRIVAGLRRRPFPYATSFPLEHVTVRLGDRTPLELVVKDLRWSSLLGDAPSTKPPWLHRPSRQIGIHRHLLDPLGVRPRLVTSGSGAPPDGEWLAMELIAGNPLWEIGDVEVWEAATRWLARFHDAASSERIRVARLVPDLVDHSAPWLSQWVDRARRSLDGNDDPRSGAARELLDTLGQRPWPPGAPGDGPTIVHGELYPSNVLVEAAPPTGDADGWLEDVESSPVDRICPIDWELVGIGDRFLDLAALTTGWLATTAERLVDAYLSASRVRAMADHAVALQLAWCRSVNAVRWIGWSPAWSPPDEHAHDWIGELLAQAEVLGA